MMKRKLVWAVLLIAMGMIPNIARGQYTTVYIFDDTLKGAAVVSRTFTVPIARLDFSDTNRAAYILTRVDTTDIRGTAIGDTSAWADSGYVPAVIWEYKYNLPGQFNQTSDTLLALQNSGNAWITGSDSMTAFTKWNWEPVKLLGLSDNLTFRVRDKSTALKGPRRGIRVRLVVVARLRNP